MKVTDLDGRTIEVTDLAAAIAQAEWFKDCGHEPPQLIADDRQRAYWTDIYNKLVALRNRIPRHGNTGN